MPPASSSKDLSCCVEFALKQSSQCAHCSRESRYGCLQNNFANELIIEAKQWMDTWKFIVLFFLRLCMLEIFHDKKF